MRGVGVLLATAAVALGASVATAGASSVLTTTVDPRAKGPVVPSGFLGYSIEIPEITVLGGLEPVGINTAMVGLFEQFRRTGQGTPTVRMGGGTQDNTFWNPTYAPPPPGAELTYDLDEIILGALRRFVQRTGAGVIFGLNLAANSPQLAVDEARAVAQRIPRRNLIALDIGNEPDNYPERSFGKDASGREQNARGPTYGPRDFLAEYDRVRRAVIAAVPGIPVSGPSVNDPRFVRRLPEFVATQRQGLGMLATHAYPMTACAGFTPQASPKLLVANYVAETSVKRLVAPYVRAAGKLPVRVTETNSASCGGKSGTSNTFASTLWAADWTFINAYVGVRGMNFTAAPNPYQPFLNSYENGRWGITVAPMHYGLLAFAETAPAGARILETATSKAKLRQGQMARVWATLGKDRRTVRVLALHKRGRTGTMTLRVPGAGRRVATVKRLISPSLTSPEVSWGGQRVPAKSPDGALRGTLRTERLRASRDGTFRLRIRATEGALLTVKLPRAVRR